jgi:hypothetical protein
MMTKTTPIIGKTEQSDPVVVRYHNRKKVRVVGLDLRS